MMFTYFKEQGLDNLIWVWTSENKDDANWYPGDEYVDIIGRDLYGKTAEECAEEFKALTALYGDRMIALTECGYYADSNDASKMRHWEYRSTVEQWSCMVVVYAMVWQCG